MLLRIMKEACRILEDEARELDALPFEGLEEMCFRLEPEKDVSNRLSKLRSRGGGAFAQDRIYIKHLAPPIQTSDVGPTPDRVLSIRAQRDRHGCPSKNRPGPIDKFSRRDR